MRGVRDAACRDCDRRRCSDLDAARDQSGALGALLNPIDELLDDLVRWTGLNLRRSGRLQGLAQLVAARAHALRLGSVQEYVRRLTGPNDPELARVISAVTVCTTWFLRDREQLDLICDILREGPRDRPAHVWVAGCATGEDAYSIAVLARSIGRPLSVLATDMNSEVLEHARRGQYGTFALQGLPEELRDHFRPCEGGRVEVDPSVRKQVRFELHNLMAPPPPADGGGWDVILCRNVLIYFDPKAARATLGRLGRELAPDGWLMVGGSEIIHEAPPDLELLQRQRRFGLQRALAPRRSAPMSPSSPSPPSMSPPALPPVVFPPVVTLSAGPAADESHLLAIAGACLDAGRFGQAIESCAAILERDPLCAEARMLVGMAHYLSEDHSAATQALRSALCLDARLWPASLYLAACHLKAGLRREATREYGRGLETSEGPECLRSHPRLLRDLEELRHTLGAVLRSGLRD